jgi:hypothetical protein
MRNLRKTAKRKLSSQKCEGRESYEKEEKLVKKQKDRYKVEQIVEGGRVMRGIDKDAVVNRYNVKIAQIDQRVSDEEAVEKDRYNVMKCTGTRSHLVK